MTWMAEASEFLPIEEWEGVWEEGAKFLNGGQIKVCAARVWSPKVAFERSLQRREKHSMVCFCKIARQPFKCATKRGAARNFHKSAIVKSYSKFYRS